MGQKIISSSADCSVLCTMPEMCVSQIPICITSVQVWRMTPCFKDPVRLKIMACLVAICLLDIELPPFLWVSLPIPVCCRLCPDREASVEKEPGRGNRVKAPPVTDCGHAVSVESVARLAGSQLQSSWLVFQAPLCFEWKKAFCLRPRLLGMRCLTCGT